MLELMVHLPHARARRARVVATGANQPQLQHVPRGCFLKMAVDLQYYLPRAGVDVVSQRLGKLMEEQSTEGGQKTRGKNKTKQTNQPQHIQLRKSSGQKLGE